MISNTNITKPAILVMFSGGLDSLGALYILLNDKRYENYLIHAHHIVIKNKELRDEAESIAVANVLDYFSKGAGQPRLSYSESMIECPSFNGNFLIDADIVNFFSGNFVLQNPNFKYTAIGRTKSDDMSTGNYNTRTDRARVLYGLYCSLDTRIYPVLEYTKEEVYYLLPPDLRKLAWSCRTPVMRSGKISPCGGCKTCVNEFAFLKRST